MPRILERYLSFCLLFGLLLSACAPDVVAVGARSFSQNGTQNAARTPVPNAVKIPATRTLTPIPTLILPPATPTLPGRIGCAEKTGSLEKGKLETPLMAKPILYNVYLPPCYSVDLTTRYPVLYLLHGQTFDEGQWIRLGAVTVADRLISSGETKPFMMVFPLDPDTKQPREYNFEEVFTSQLVATIDDNHRTLTTPAYRAIGGISRGGAWALRLGLEHPDLFGSIGGHSTSIFYADDTALERIMVRLPPAQLPRIWLDAGDNDVEMELIAPLEAFMTENNIPHEWHMFVGEHSEKYWSAHVYDYLEWYTQDWR